MEIGVATAADSLAVYGPINLRHWTATAEPWMHKERADSCAENHQGHFMSYIIDPAHYSSENEERSASEVTKL